MVIHRLVNLDDTKNFAKQLADQILLTKKNTCLLFYGAMGSGKTTLIRELGLALGIQEKITSPTFIGMNEYHLDDLSFYHYDLYQVAIEFETLAELLEIPKQTILAIEWADNLNQSLIDLLENNASIIKLSISLEGKTRLMDLSS